MAQVDVMYQYSLSSFLLVFKRALKRALPDIVTEKRLNNIVDTLTKTIYEYGCAGIFEKHKLLFSFHIATKLMLDQGLLVQKELDFFLKGSMTLDEDIDPCPVKWLSETNWKDFVFLGTKFSDDFEPILMDFKDNLSKWQDWYESETPETDVMMEQCSNFQRLMLIRCFRVDRIVRSMNLYISEIMTDFYITPPVVNFEKMCDENEPEVPIIIILSPGSDPTEQLMKLAERRDKLDGFKYISLGSGQEPKALSMLSQSVQTGDWLMLQNGHLLVHFMKKLDKVMENISNVHKSFRLWITTEPTSKFPIGDEILFSKVYFV